MTIIYVFFFSPVSQSPRSKSLDRRKCGSGTIIVKQSRVKHRL